MVARVLSHDLRNPLNVAMGRLETDDTEIVERQLERMNDIIENALVFARGTDNVKPTSVDLETIAREAWQSVDSQSAVLEIAGTTTIRADTRLLPHLFENLYRNAVEHGSTNSPSQARENSVEHGSTDNRDASRLDDAVEHGSTNSPSQARENSVERGELTVTVTVGPLDDGFYVEDDGPGLPDDGVFEAGVSSDGTGLGLAIVQAVVDAHGWQIRTRNTPGARFEFVTSR